MIINQNLYIIYHRCKQKAAVLELMLTGEEADDETKDDRRDNAYCSKPQV